MRSIAAIGCLLLLAGCWPGEQDCGECRVDDDDDTGPDDDDTGPDDDDSGSDDDDSGSDDDDSAPGPAPDGASVLTSVHVWDGDTDRGGTWHVVLVADAVWTITQDDAVLQWVEDEDVADLRGDHGLGDGDLYVAPGLIDSRVHLADPGTPADVGDETSFHLRAQLAAGVTGVIDAAGPAWIRGVADRIEAGEVIGPRILGAAGPARIKAGDVPCEYAFRDDRCDPPGDDATPLPEEEFVAFSVGLEGDAIIDAVWPASLAGHPVVYVTATRGSDWTTAAAEVAARGGEPLWMTLPERGAYDGAASTPDVAVSSLTLATSLAVIAQGGGGPDRSGAADFLNPRAATSLAAYTSEAPAPHGLGGVDRLSATPVFTATEEWLAALDAGGVVPVVAGSGAGRGFVPHGWGLHQELELLSGTLEPEEALRRATSLPASLIPGDVAPRLGSIAAAFDADGATADDGPLADLVVTDAPLAGGAAHASSVVLVVANGVAHTPGALLAAETSVVDPAAESVRCLDDGDCTEEDTACDRIGGDCRSTCDGGCGSGEICRTASGLPEVPFATQDDVRVCVSVPTCTIGTVGCLGLDAYPSRCVDSGTGVPVCIPSRFLDPLTVPGSCDASYPENLCPAALECIGNKAEGHTCQ